MKTKCLVIGASNSSRPPVKCWPQYVSEHFNIHIRNAALRGTTPEHVYDMYAENIDYNPDLILVDIPPWYRYHIALSTTVQNVSMNKIINVTENYEEVEYKSFKGIVPIGGFITDTDNYAEWLKKQIIPNSSLSLYDVYKRRTKNRKSFDTNINALNDVRHSSYFKHKAYKDILLLKSVCNVPIKFLHTIGPYDPIDLPQDDFLCENPYNWIKDNFNNYEEFFQDEWAHFTPSSHQYVSENLYIPAIENLLNNIS